MCTKKFTLIDRHCNSPSLAELALRNWLKLIQGNRLDLKSDKSVNLGCNKRYYLNNIIELRLIFYHIILLD